MADSRRFEMPRNVASVYLDGVREIKQAFTELLSGELSPDRCKLAQDVVLRVRQRTEPALHRFWESAGELRSAVSDFRCENNEAFQAVMISLAMVIELDITPPAFREQLPHAVAEFDRLIDGWGLATASRSPGEGV